MNNSRYHLLCFSLAAGLSASAQTPAPEAPATPPSDTPAPKRSFLKYTPPKSAGAGGVRIDGDGGSRGTSGKPVELFVLAPSGVAYTTQKQPSLFYFQGGSSSEAAASRLTFALVQPNKPVPLIKAVAAKSEVGIRRIQIPWQGVELQPSVRYVWSIAIGMGSEGKSQDILASGSVEYKEASKELTEALAANPSRKAAVYAEHGIWYDALDEISRQIAADPQNRMLLEERASLLDQVGLSKVNTLLSR